MRAQDTAGNWSAYASGPEFELSAHQETSTAIAYTGTWTRSTLSGAYGGSVKQASAAGTKARFTFTGRNVAWASTKGPDRGIAEVWLNGVKVATVDLYAPTTQLRQVVYTRRNLDPSRTYTLEIRPTGTRNPAAGTGTRVDIDAFAIIR